MISLRTENSFPEPYRISSRSGKYNKGGVKLQIFGSEATLYLLISVRMTVLLQKTYTQKTYSQKAYTQKTYTQKTYTDKRPTTQKTYTDKRPTLKRPTLTKDLH